MGARAFQTGTMNATERRARCDALPGYFKGRHVYELATSVRRFTSFVELGAFLGQSTCHLAQLLLERKRARNLAFELDVVDAWATSTRWVRDPASVSAIALHGGARNAWAAHMAATSSLGAVRSVTRAWATDAVGRFANQSVDFLYLDTEHTYEYTRAQLRAWGPAVRGWVCGDDYCRPGVRRAVEEVFGAKRVEYLGYEQFCVATTGRLPSRPLARLASPRQRADPCCETRRHC